MGINIRTKGASAEREIADDLNYIIFTLHKEMGIEGKPYAMVQRNQNQSAVGGKDLVGTPGMAIEVKRQEALSINTWWRQCVASATVLDELPVLLFRQSKQKWRCITLAYVDLPDNTRMKVRVEMDYDDFKTWFRSWYKATLEAEPETDVEYHPGLFDAIEAANGQSVYQT